MIVYFLRGLPGSGKTTLAKEIEDVHTWAKVGTERCEADRFFVTPEGKYEFDASKLADAHASCMAGYKRALDKKVYAVIVSNTSVHEEHVEAYRSLAEKAGYAFVSLIVENRHGGNNIHDVPANTLERMERQFSTKLI